MESLATRYDKHAIVYRAAVLIQATIAWIHQWSGAPWTGVSSVKI